VLGKSGAVGTGEGGEEGAGEGSACFYGEPGFKDSLSIRNQFEDCSECLSLISSLEGIRTWDTHWFEGIRSRGRG
jgi:hypothetical protein